MGAVHIKSQKGHAFAQMFKTAKPFIFWTDWPSLMIWVAQKMNRVWIHRKARSKKKKNYGSYNESHFLFGKTSFAYFIWISYGIFRYKTKHIFMQRSYSPKKFTKTYQYITSSPLPPPPSPQNPSKRSWLRDGRIQPIQLISLEIFQKFLQCSPFHWLALHLAQRNQTFFFFNIDIYTSLHLLFLFVRIISFLL